ncbi:KinB-signaling pathway activation protein [Paenibacillus sediminis]|uniref:KinB signaling pathway activation protein n=1 Tax=Paenibacillus sediminis TaxID=664909 RepID=A0ABS4H735_9BACL|nr:KinB-signaling pathway activation protein [Paenibacillus sediminis]MBP1938342.1 KinB signaling pathway activation protein [Paenibacillus sediminis]
MNLKRWFYLFWTTLLVGAVASLITGVILKWTEQGTQLKGFADVIMLGVLLLGSGIMVSIYSQMGFFAYLMMNYMAVGVFSKRVWQYIQLGLAALALLELMFFRIFVGGQTDRLSDIVLGIVILLTAVIVAYYKVKGTNASAFIPTLFFMITGTIVEVIGVLSIGVNNATVFIVIPLLACNAYQILLLHRILQQKS